MYSEKLMKLFLKPHNMGKIKNADGIGKVGNPKCGDVMYLYIKVKNNKIADIKFETFGCAAAIATSSIVTDMAKGLSIENAEKLTKDDVIKSIDGLPPQKIHCSLLAIDALHAAIDDYKNKKDKIKKK